MKNKIKYLSALILVLMFVQCSDYLDTSSSSDVDDEFVTSSTSEAFKVMSWCYAEYRQKCIMGSYRWNDHFGSDSEYYPESGSANNLNARLMPEELTVDAAETGFNCLYAVIARTSTLIEEIETKSDFAEARDEGTVNDWTHLYGEAMTMKAYCYFQLVKHFGDVPYGYENTIVDDYSLTSRFEIYDHVIDMLDEAIPLMYKLGEGDITAERMSKPFAEAIAGAAALYSGGWQTIRTDIDTLYGDVQLTTKGNEEYNSIYARRTDYMDYYEMAETYFDAAMDDRGTCELITSDERSYANNPFQRHFQYFHDLEVSPESIFELGNIQGGDSDTSTSSEYPFAFGRPSNGGSTNSAPCKTFGALRIIPTFYYGEFEEGDIRRDASVAVTGSNGDGNEVILSFTPGNKLNGGMAINKWDENRMNPPYTAAQRQSGMNWPVLRLADLMLMQAEVKAELGEDAEALSIVNEIRSRAFGDDSHSISATGDDLKEAIMQERKLELLGEGTRRWDLIRSGKMVERAVETREEMSEMVSDLEAQGYHEFENGNVISNYIWVKSVHLDEPLTYDADESDPALYPGWRGQYDYSTTDVADVVEGTDHNLAIKGLFEYIDPDGDEAKALEADGYEKTSWGKDIVTYADHYCDTNLFPGVASGNVPPRYYWPMPADVLSGSNGKVTNGYGLAQE